MLSTERTIALLDKITRRHQQDEMSDLLKKITTLAKEAIDALLVVQVKVASALEGLRLSDQRLVDLIEDEDYPLAPSIGEGIRDARERLVAAIESLDDLPMAFGSNDLDDAAHFSGLLDERTEAMYRDLYNSPSVVS
jgi:hypothetical protein